MTSCPPAALAVSTGSIPLALIALPRWVAWRYQPAGPHWRKVPKDCKTGRNARVTDPACWSTFDLARATLRRRKRDRPDGIGFVLNGDGLVGVDLDGCRDPTTGVIECWAADIITQLDTYAEVSPSGTGVKLLLYGRLPPYGRKAGNVEMYADKRFFTLTGHRLAGVPEQVMDRPEQLLDLHRSRFGRERADAAVGGVFPLVDKSDEEVVGTLLAGEDGRVRQLLAGDWSAYPSESEADLALCGHFARAVGPDRGRIERLFGRSGLANRRKWSAGADYRQRTIERAVDGLAEYAGRGGRATIGLAKSIQEHSEHSTTQVVDGCVEVSATVGLQPSAIDEVVALADEQGGQGDDFAVSFNLARRLLNHGDSPEPFADVVREFCQQAGRDFDEFWVQFLVCWPKVRSAEGAGDWAWAAAQAVERPIEFVPGGGWAVNRVATLAYHLSLLRSQFAFPVETVGAACDWSAMMGTRLIKLLVQRGVLKRVKEPNRHTHEAAEYVFLASPPSAEEKTAA